MIRYHHHPYTVCLYNNSSNVKPALCGWHSRLNKSRAKVLSGMKPRVSFGETHMSIGGFKGEISTGKFLVLVDPHVCWSPDLLYTMYDEYIHQQSIYKQSPNNTRHGGLRFRSCHRRKYRQVLGWHIQTRNNGSIKRTNSQIVGGNSFQEHHIWI